MVITVGGPFVVVEGQLTSFSCFADPEAVTGEKDAVLDKAKLVFAGNYERLQGIKKKYDPESIFNKWLPIIPA